jgi:deoxycytidine triphosphate deaminase
MKKTPTDFVKGIIHEGKQLSEDKKVLYLTAKKVGKISGGGSLDFGGDEYSEAVIEWIEPQKKSEDDDYGWWYLDEDSYWIEYNETIDLPRGTALFLQPWEKAVAAGLVHPSGYITDSINTLATVVTVGDYTVSLKENARISKVIVPGD